MDLSSLLQGAMGQQIVGAAAQQLGINESQAQTAVGAAIPFLLSALNKNAQSGGANGIANALNQHDGSILDNLSGFLGQGGNMQDGLGILGHVLGGNQETVANNIGKQTGLDSGQIIKILALVAPIVMGFLGKQKQEQGLQSDGIAGLLGGLIGGTNQAAGGINLGGFEKLLDQDGDGQLGASDVMGLLGGFFKK
ncbi:DUF937 domain-containing protein [Faecalibacter bovis]|uniref:DUF937 domain-containing protein n=1 Tax=Faecalibacter bovis TaxID=2898187 RepID=A0ABX7XA12_9FLAO|nr:DUF937 domain-containing protein [Faecalibacter bovis]MBS7332684.1 DUF937 domain-containing protein [Weeksellaceae bacterium]QTV04710.1 DUF937 domain-containing protein [Faecalibacter bovis]